MEPEPRSVRVFLVDDHEVVRRGVAEVLEDDPGITVAGEAGSCAEALARVPAVRPDVAVVDMRLPDGDGADLVRRLRERLPAIRCLVLSSYADEDAIAAALAAGAVAVGAGRREDLGARRHLLGRVSARGRPCLRHPESHRQQACGARAPRAPAPTLVHQPVPLGRLAPAPHPPARGRRGSIPALCTIGALTQAAEPASWMTSGLAHPPHPQTGSLARSPPALHDGQ
jgi:CheY-like chemotaxis protein